MSDRKLSITVRCPNHHDIYYLTVEMERLAPDTVDWNTPPPDYGFILAQTLDMARVGRVAVACLPDGKPIGIIVINTGHWPWNPQAAYWENLHFWVHPDHRKSSAAKDLIAWYKQVAHDTKLPARLTETFGTEADDEFKARWYRTCGFKQIGRNYLFEPHQEPDLFGGGQ